MSVVQSIKETLEQVKNAVNDIRLEVKKACCPSAEANATFHTPCKNLATKEIVPVKELMILDGSLNGKRVRVLKDDGCNTNVVSRDFFEINKGKLKWKKCEVEVRHSKHNSVERSSEVIVGATLVINGHVYKSNWLVANCRYDVLLGMPWHVSSNPDTNYKHRIVKVGSHVLHPIVTLPKEKVEVQSISVKKFRSLLSSKRNKDDTQIFQLVPQVNSSELMTSRKTDFQVPRNMKLQMVLDRYSTVFREELPPGLPPKRFVDHEIETDKDSKPPHRSLYQLSPVELRATKDYVKNLIEKGKIRPSKSPYGAPLFFVKDKDKPLRGVVDYRALNRITKRNNAPLPRSDEMFDLLGEAKVFSKMDLKTGFHQIRVKPSDIEKTAFNTKYGQFEYLVMPMGLCNAPATFQSLMNQIFYDCVDVFMVVYMDDLLIFSKDEKSHLQHLDIVLSRLKDHRLYVSPKKVRLYENGDIISRTCCGAKWT